jgi:hypothetical protein
MKRRTAPRRPVGLFGCGLGVRGEDRLGHAAAAVAVAAEGVVGVHDPFAYFAIVDAGHFGEGVLQNVVVPIFRRDPDGVNLLAFAADAFAYGHGASKRLQETLLV